eukprot:15055217-Alexandrium_andersonii.AAC.1
MGFIGPNASRPSKPRRVSLSITASSSTNGSSSSTLGLFLQAAPLPEGGARRWSNWRLLLFSDGVRNCPK